MKDHDTYQAVIMPEDIDGKRRRDIVDALAEFLNEPDVRFEESPDGPLELVVPEPISSTRTSVVRDTLQARIPYAFDDHETVVLDLHVNWPKPRYRICIDFQ